MSRQTHYYQGNRRHREPRKPAAATGPREVTPPNIRFYGLGQLESITKTNDPRSAAPRSAVAAGQDWALVSRPLLTGLGMALGLGGFFDDLQAGIGPPPSNAP